MNDESHLARLRRLIDGSYEAQPTGCGASFGEILCWEIHSNGDDVRLAGEEVGSLLPTLGELVWDCKRLEEEPRTGPQLSAVAAYRRWQ